MARVRLNPSVQAAVNKALPKGISEAEAQTLVKKITSSKASPAEKTRQLKALQDEVELSLTRGARNVVDRAIVKAVSDQNSKGWQPKVSGGGGYSGGGSR